jgi:hypothetical protein
LLRRLTFPLIAAAAALLVAGCGRGGPGTPNAQTQAAAPERDAEAQAAFVDHPLMPLHAAAPERGSLKVGRHWIYYVRGGTMTTVRSPSRDMVSDLIKNVGGVAGLNGTFFSDARVAGRGNKMIGPLLTGADAQFAPTDPFDAPRCVGRPMVVLGASTAAIVPYALWMGDSAEALRRLVPDATDGFLAGGWLVHNGVAATKEEIAALCVADAMDFRRRAFMGVDDEGRIVLGASDYSVDSARLARALEDLHLQEAVLLDSGFSTSLVWKDKILVSGHSRKSMPSRPVPHALVILPGPASAVAGAPPNLPENPS